ncbi:hypothetical protein G6F56_012436 [Rhizopus delemar]|nr:hypothetical protein G6F56_012436 [Rhizopus delemar]
MENLLSEKQALIDSKEQDLSSLKERLEKLETGLATPEQDVQPDQMVGLEEKMRELEGSDESILLKQLEQLQSEKEQLMNLIEQKEADMAQFKREMEELRESAQEIQDSNQSKLKELSAQLNEEHASQMKAVKEDYENQLDSLNVTLKTLQEPSVDIDDEKKKLLLRIGELEQLSADSKSSHQDQLAELKAQATSQLEDLAARHQEQIDKITNDLKVSHFLTYKKIMLIHE